MDENVIFGSSQAARPVTSSTPQPLSSQPLSENPQSSSSKTLLKKVIKLTLGVLAVVALGLVIFSFVIPNLPKKSTNEKIALLYWGLWEDAGAIKSIISDFEKQHPNITVNYVKQDINQYRERLVARIQNGTGPDVFRLHSTWWPMFSSVLAPFSKDTITKADFEKWFYKVAQNDLVKNGAIYGIPLEVDTLSLYINTQMFKSQGLTSPKNWVDFSNIARQLTVKDENGKLETAGAAVGTFDNITHAGDVVSLFLVQNGTDLNDIALTEQLASDALSFYTSFAISDKVWDNTFDPSVLSFAKGNVAMFFGYSWDFFTIKDTNPDLSFEIHSIPHLPDKNTTVASYWAEGASIKSKHQREAMLFLKYLAQKEVQQKLFAEQSKTKDFGEPYARRDLAALLKEDSNIYPFVFQAEDAVSSFFASDTYDNGLNSQTNVYLGDAVNAILNGTSPETATDTLQKGVSQVLKQYSIKK